MQSKTLLILLLLGFSTIGCTNGRRFSSSFSRSRGWSSFGRSSNSRGTSVGRSSSSRHGSSSSPKSTSPGHVPSMNHSPPGSGHYVPHSGGTSTGRNNVNTNFLNAEGGGATRPAQRIPPQTSSTIGRSHLPNSGKTPSTTIESRQTSAGLHPSAPAERVIKPTNNALQNQGQTNPSWSNPNFGNNHGATPTQGNYPWSNPSFNANQPSKPSQPQSSWSSPYSPVNQPTYPVDIGNGKSTRRRTGSSGGWSFGSRSRTTPRPRVSQTSHTSNQQPNQGGSTPNKVGWNVPDKTPTGTNTAAKPSAPINEHTAKTSANNVQSGYTPSGGYPRQPASNPYHTNANPQPYNPSAGQHYNPSPGQGYNPSVGQGYHNPSMGAHPPPYGVPPPAYNAPSYGGYNPGYGPPSYGQSFGQPFGSMGHAPQQTILVGQSQRPGIGQLAKEAFVFAGVSAGVNAAVNRLLPGGIYGNRGSSGGGGGGGGVSHTEITYNNYYNNGTAPAAAPAPAPASEPAGAAPANNPVPTVQPLNQPAAQPAAEPSKTSQNNAGTNSEPLNNANSQDSTQNNPNPLGFVTSNDDIKKLTESLFEKEKNNNAFKYITMSLQGQKKDDSTTDDASEPLLDVKAEAYEIPTVKAVLALHDNYELDVKTKEVVTSEERREESDLLDKILDTETMKTTMKFLADKGYIQDDEYEFKDTMKRIWFSQFKRIDGEPSSSGFETVFLAEQFDSDIIGLHNWIYYAKQESEKKINYLGYIKEVKLGDKGAVLKVRSSLNGMIQPVTTLFVGTSPELEFALYTMCFFTRPNNVCPVSLGGSEFMIIVSRINYFGKDILISGYPDI